MWLDDDEPKKKKEMEPRKLDGLSIAELNTYIAWLNSEIDRSKEAIGAREAAAQTAGQFFKQS